MEYGTLYLVATPIGNLEDLTPRAAATLGMVDFIAAEDTRVSQKLLQHLGLHKPMVSYYAHNCKQRGQEILARLLAGQSCALITDAGTPAISDPGQDLTDLCLTHGIQSIPLPGACAAVCALAASGLPSTYWCFEGFLPVDKKPRRERLAILAQETRTMILYEAPHKLCAALQDLMQALGSERQISLSRELTKLYEETKRFTLAQAVEYYHEHTPRGEFVLVIAGKELQTADEEAERLLQAIRAAKKQIAAGESYKDAAKQASEAYQVRKNAVYQALLQDNA